MKSLPAFLLFLLLCGYAPGQPVQFKQNRTIILDTDGGITDYRAIYLFLSRPELTIKGIIVSDGILDPDNGYKKVSGLLAESRKEKIPVGTGKSTGTKVPLQRQENLSFQWSKSNILIPGKKSSINLLTEILEQTAEKITYICLGPLTAIVEIQDKKPELTKNIERILWYNDHVNPFRGFNYEYDSLAAKKILSSNIRIDIISNLQNEHALIDPLNFMKSTGKDGAIMTDELVTVYFFNPALFDMNPWIGKTRIRHNTNYNLHAVKEVISDMISGNYYPDENIVFTRFPSDRKHFSYDVRQIMDSAISRYGMDEWKACVITDEFHGHLGVYSIAGAKMGIKARELFGVGPDILRVVSYAGNKPPYSCLNDGIQVSTGSTLGMGLISLAPGNETRAMADFTYKDRTIRISLKKEYLNQVDHDIEDGIIKFGLMDDGYWKQVRQSAIRYWLEWDRNFIFDIEEVKPK